MSYQPISTVPESRLAPILAAAIDRWLPAIILLVATLVAWEAAVWIFDISAFIVPAPSAIAESLVAQWPVLMQATMVTAG